MGSARGGRNYGVKDPPEHGFVRVGTSFHWKLPVVLGLKKVELFFDAINGLVDGELEGRRLRSLENQKCGIRMLKETWMGLGLFDRTIGLPDV